MDLHSTILGLLSWKPCSGYDLKRLISDSEIFYWSGNNNQVYKSLLELQNEGLVTHRVLTQENLPAKKIYSITEEGRAVLRHSLLAKPDLPELRHGFLIQLAWAEPLDDEQVLALLMAYEGEAAHRLRMVQLQAARPNRGPARSAREALLWEAISEQSVMAWQAELDWIRRTMLRFSEEMQAGWPKNDKEEHHDCNR